MVPVELSKIVIRDNVDQQYIFVKEIGGLRGFPIIIGRFEAAEINRKVMESQTLRPMTHDLIRLIIQALDVKLTKIVINDLRDGTFFANLYLKQGDREVWVDCRPSDAIALATAQTVPMFVEDHVMDQVGKMEGQEES